jgi:hypothetical protein
MPDLGLHRIWIKSAGLKIHAANRCSCLLPSSGHGCPGSLTATSTSTFPQPTAKLSRGAAHPEQSNTGANTDG